MQTNSTIFFLIISILFLFSCRVKLSEESVEIQSDSLRQHIEETVEKKKKILAVKKQIESARYNRSILKYSPVIKKYAKRYGFDWRLIIAQIMQESRFREHARSPVGARGLMQLMPGTEREIRRELDFEYILKNPRENIAAGIYHMKKQFQYFPRSSYSNRLKLSLAAYNSGQGRVFDSQDIARFFKDSPDQWRYIKLYITKLKREDWKIHLQVWPQGRPKHGYFYGYRETISYVENIWEMYEIYRQIF